MARVKTTGGLVVSLAIPIAQSQWTMRIKKVASSIVA